MIGLRFGIWGQSSKRDYENTALTLAVKTNFLIQGCEPYFFIFYALLDIDELYEVL